MLKTYKELSRSHTPIVFIEGKNVFADGRSQRLVDLIVNIEYSSTEDTSPDFNTALSRRIKKSNTYKNQSIPTNYIQNTWNNKLCYYCTYFHDTVWIEMIRHKEYRCPSGWNTDNVIKLFATSDIKLNVNQTLNFIHPKIAQYL